MIEDPPILTISRRFPRPTPEQVASTPAAFRDAEPPCHAGPGDCLAVLDVIQPGDAPKHAAAGKGGR